VGKILCILFIYFIEKRTMTHCIDNKIIVKHNNTLYIRKKYEKDEI
jgi:hypothetical protein